MKAILGRLSPKSLMVLSYFFYATSDLYIKLATGSLKTIDVVFLRSSFSLILLGLVFRKNIFETIKNIKAYDLSLGLISFGALLCAVESLKTLHLGTFAVINLTIPLFANLLAVFVLKENMTSQKILKLMLGFGGALLVVHDNGLMIDSGMFWALISAILNTLTFVVLKKSTSEHKTIFLSYIVVCFILTGFLEVLNFKPIEFSKLGLEYTFKASLAHLVAFYLCITAYKLDELSNIVHLEYVQVVIAFLYSWGIFHLTPTSLELCGSAFVAMSLFNFKKIDFKRFFLRE